jgi:hypothetical protein
MTVCDGHSYVVWGLRFIGGADGSASAVSDRVVTWASKLGCDMFRVAMMCTF